MCEDLTWCFSCIISHNSHHNSMGMILLSWFYELGNLKEVTSPRSQSQRMEGQWVKPGCVHLQSLCLLSDQTLCFSVPWKQCSRQAPWNPASGQCRYGCFKSTVHNRLCHYDLFSILTFMYIGDTYSMSNRTHCNTVRDVQIISSIHKSSVQMDILHWVLPGQRTRCSSLTCAPPGAVTLLSETATASAPEAAFHWTGNMWANRSGTFSTFTSIAITASTSTTTTVTPAPPRGCSACEASPQPFYGRCRYPYFADEETKSPRS